MIKHKFNAKRTEVGEHSFPSRAEARYYEKLVAAQKSGELLFFLMQVPLRLPGKTKYLVDFVEFWADGTVKFVEVKGLMTPMAALKIRQCQELYPITIEVIK